MDVIRVLLTKGLTEEEYIHNINIIVDSFNLSFSAQEINNVFEKVRNCYTQDINRRLNLFYLLLNTNPRMFVALAYAIINDKIRSDNLYFLIWQGEGISDYRLGFKGSWCSNGMKIMRETMCMLQEYYEFDMTDLYLEDSCRNYIQYHIDQNKRGKLTKAAVKK